MRTVHTLERPLDLKSQVSLCQILTFGKSFDFTELSLCDNEVVRLEYFCEIFLSSEIVGGSGSLFLGTFPSYPSRVRVLPSCPFIKRTHLLGRFFSERVQTVGHGDLSLLRGCCYFGHWQVKIHHHPEMIQSVSAPVPNEQIPCDQR